MSKAYLKENVCILFDRETKTNSANSTVSGQSLSLRFDFLRRTGRSAHRVSFFVNCVNGRYFGIVGLNVFIVENCECSDGPLVVVFEFD